MKRVWGKRGIRWEEEEELQKVSLGLIKTHQPFMCETHQPQCLDETCVNMPPVGVWEHVRSHGCVFSQKRGHQAEYLAAQKMMKQFFSQQSTWCVLNIQFISDLCQHGLHTDILRNNSNCFTEMPQRILLWKTKLTWRTALHQQSVNKQLLDDGCLF